MSISKMSSICCSQKSANDTANDLMQLKCNTLGDNTLMKLISINNLDLLGVIFDPQTGMIPVFENTQKTVKHGSVEISSEFNRFFDDDETTTHHQDHLKYENLLEKDNYNFDTLEIEHDMNIFETVPTVIEDINGQSAINCTDELLLGLNYCSNTECENEDQKDNEDVPVKQVKSSDAIAMFNYQVINQNEPSKSKHPVNDNVCNYDDKMFVIEYYPNFQNSPELNKDVFCFKYEPNVKIQTSQNSENINTCNVVKTQEAKNSKKLEAASGVVKPKKRMKENPCSGGCPNKCVKLNEEDRQSLFDYYWSLNYTKQRDFLLKYINVHEIRRRRIKSATRKSLTRDYFLPKDGIKFKVCRRFFMSTLDVTDKLLRYTETSGNGNNSS